MPFTAEFRSGDPIMVDYVNGSTPVPAGEVIVTTDTPRVCHVDIPANAKGALAVHGGIYRMTADAAIAADKIVFWDAAAKKVTVTATNNKRFGVTVNAAAAANDLIEVVHRPA